MAIHLVDFPAERTPFISQRLNVHGLFGAAIQPHAVAVDNADQVAQVKEKPKTMGWFVGQVMKASGGKANPQAVNEILKAKLGL